MADGAVSLITGFLIFVGVVVAYLVMVIAVLLRDPS